MLLKLTISNYALIKEVTIDFTGGFTVITGETGAGKSIILGAINILIGGRASVKLLDNKARKSIIEGVFKSNLKLNKLLSDLDLDTSQDLILRREIKPNGSSRTFINDSPVKVDQLKIISPHIIELNGQHLINEMGKLDFNYHFIDGFLKDKQVLNDYSKSYKSYKEYDKLYKELTQKSLVLKEKKDFLTFQLNELTAFSFDQINEKEVNDEYDLIANQELLNSHLEQFNFLYSSENGISSRLFEIDDILSKLGVHMKGIQPFVSRINSVKIEIDDLFEEINKKFPVKPANPQRLKELDDLIGQINYLVKKFNVIDIDSLKIKRDSIQQEIIQIENLDEQIVDCQNKRKYWKNKSLNYGNVLFDSRKENFSSIENKVNKVLRTISMDHADFKLQIQKSEDLSPNGIDKLALLISVNRKKEYFPINKFSSGGELSRIALAMKSVASFSNSVPVLIFDEIDSGISGKVASEVGLLLKQIAKNIQVINITHLPQVAALGNVHFHVEKKNSVTGMESKLMLLRHEERIQVLANMLGGDKTGSAARNNALELLN